MRLIRNLKKVKVFSSGQWEEKNDGKRINYLDQLLMELKSAG